MQREIKRYAVLARITVIFVFAIFFLPQSILMAKTQTKLPDMLLVACQEFEKCGIMNLYEKYIVKPTYIHISPLFVNGYSAVRDENSRYGLMDIHGNWKPDRKFKSISYFSEDLAVARDMNDKVGYIDYGGNWVIEPQFTSANDFKEGVAVVMVGMKCNLIDKNGAWLRKPTFKSVQAFENGLAIAELFVDDMYQRRFGYINTKGDWAVPPDYAWFQGFGSDGYTAATKFDASNPRGEGELVYVDTKGKVYRKRPVKIKPPTPSYQEEDYSRPLEDMSPWEDEKTGKWGYMNVSGEWALAPKFDYADNFQEVGLARACLRLKCGLINKKGAWVVRPQYDVEYFASEFEDGVSIVRRDNDTVGVINAKGKWVVKPRYERLVPIRFLDKPLDKPQNKPLDRPLDRPTDIHKNKQ
ncbi:MAG: WG repeat-containing protein [Clostridiales Family XIII bacterium]|jgi:hypothetical protein|nr:WG repeat-containing protein [Clostridiales Family XIII bacterium]